MGLREERGEGGGGGGEVDIFAQAPDELIFSLANRLIVMAFIAAISVSFDIFFSHRLPFFHLIIHLLS
jgi:hypothetical protein